jgi:hypothetical protein
MPKQHIQLRDCTDKKTDYGLVCNSVFGGVNHVTFIDQQAVHMMTTAHDVVNEDPHWRDAKTRRDTCRTRARETAGRTELPYPQLSHDYNNNMNSCDLASQVWSYFTVSRYSHWRNWWPMLWIILDASIANVLYLYRLRGFTESQLSHRDLQTRIGFQLLRDPASVLRERESTVNAVGLQPSKLRRSQHEWIKAGKTSTRDLYKYTTSRPLDEIQMQGMRRLVMSQQRLLAAPSSRPSGLVRCPCLIDWYRRQIYRQIDVTKYSE